MFPQSCKNTKGLRRNHAMLNIVASPGGATIPRYIKEGSTFSVMGIVRRNENVLMIISSTEAMSTGCRWVCGLLPTYVEGLVLTYDESQNADVIPM
ncbi:hypothetical protein L6452_19543 [Arctium lappa]|uniref:Uncharacterized protein n=1 Tax=Arctium lappa TaxID=4217 RepID=A0ACB9B838_ARCLA|nr:hypothetical protein L6452_19543 [Arctium lappa]